MKRKFRVKLWTEMDIEAFYFLSTVKIAEWLKDDFYYPTNSDAHKMSIAEVTSHKDIADAIAAEVGEEMDTNVFVVYHGDNGTQDIGYELVTKGEVLCDIGITKFDGIWTVFIESGSQNIEVTSVDDIIDYLGSDTVG